MLADRVVLGGAEANTEVSHGRFQRFKALKARAISKEVSFRTRWVRQTYRRLGLPARVSLFSEPYGGGRHRELRAATERFTTSGKADALTRGGTFGFVSSFTRRDSAEHRKGSRPHVLRSVIRWLTLGDLGQPPFQLARRDVSFNRFNDPVA